MNGWCSNNLRGVASDEPGPRAFGWGLEIAVTPVAGRNVWVWGPCADGARSHNPTLQRAPFCSVRGGIEPRVTVRRRWLDAGR